LVYYKNSKLTVNENNVFKIGLDEDDTFEIIDNTNKINLEFNTIKNKNKNRNKEDFSNLKESFNETNYNSLIPSYILEGINIDQSKMTGIDTTDFKNKKFRSSVILYNTSNINNFKPKDNIILKEIWKDF
jgi:hypothetical protein